MKKMLTIIQWLIFMTLSGFAQEKEANQNIWNKKFLISFTAGPSFPVGPFASHDIHNTQAGFAKTGYNLNLDFTYTLNQSVVLDATFLYARFDIYNDALQQTGLSADHWQYYGLLIGPRYDLPFSRKSLLSIKALLGITDVNSPAFSYGSNLAVKEDWATALSLQFGMDYRYLIRKGFFIMANLDYTYMDPTLQVSMADGSASTTVRQNIAVVDITAGMGINF